MSLRLVMDFRIVSQLTGTVQKLSTDEQGKLLFDSAWGDFDLAVGDFVGHIQETD